VSAPTMAAARGARPRLSPPAALERQMRSGGAMRTSPHPVLFTASLLAAACSGQITSGFVATSKEPDPGEGMRGGSDPTPPNGCDDHDPSCAGTTFGPPS